MESLRRSESDKMIAGVCGGLGRHFEVDPNLLRLGFVLATVVLGAGIGIYVVLWLVIPSDSGDAVVGRVLRDVGGSRDALRIAEERYARGEITAEDLDRIRADLARGPGR